MIIKKEDLIITSILSGFFYRVDYRYDDKKAEIFNFISSIRKADLSILNLGSFDIIKIQNNNFPDYRLSNSYFSYEDSYSPHSNFDNYVNESRELLNKFRELLNINLFKAGIIIKSQISLPENRVIFLRDKFFKELNLGNDFRMIDFHLNYEKGIKGKEFNINLTFESSDIDKGGYLRCSLDINRKEEKGLNNSDIEEIFYIAYGYFNTDLITLLNI